MYDTIALLLQLGCGCKVWSKVGITSCWLYLACWIWRVGDREIEGESVYNYVIVGLPYICTAFQWALRLLNVMCVVTRSVKSASYTSVITHLKVGVSRGGSKIMFPSGPKQNEVQLCWGHADLANKLRMGLVPPLLTARLFALVVIHGFVSSAWTRLHSKQPHFPQNARAYFLPIRQKSFLLQRPH